MVNNELFKAGTGLFPHGRDLLQQGECSKVRPVVEQIVSLMTVPLVQGTLRYAYKVGHVPAQRIAKNAAEGSTFAAALLPMVHHCNPASATVVADNMKFGLAFSATDGTLPTVPTAGVGQQLPSFPAVKEALEKTYACLGITCDMVGSLGQVASDGLVDASVGAKCTFASPPIAGYFPGSDVTQHNALDGDQKNMEAALAEKNFEDATAHYATGGSSTSKGSFRTMKGFSTGAKGKMYDGCPGCPYKHYKMFYDYYGSHTYADDWVSAALAGTDMSFSSGKYGPNNFSGMYSAARVEAVKKGTAYMNVWMYAVREFEDAIDDCETCTTNCNQHSTNEDSVHAWDEGVAFYAGSLEGTEQGGSSSGKMVYRLAEKRCANFGTCGPAGDATSGISMVNNELFKAGTGLFPHGRDLLQQGECSKVRPIVEQIVSLMTVPLVQGTLRYAYKVGHVPAQRIAKNAAEGSTFAAALLPMVHYCHAASATTVENNMKFGLTFDSNGANPTGTLLSFPAVKGALEAVYPCLGITCDMVGSLGQVASDGLVDASVGAKCTDPTSSHVAWTPMPSTKITGDEKHKVKIEVKAEGPLSKYDDALKADLESKMATVAGVDVNAVTVTVTEATSRRRQLQAGSVILSFVIVTDDAAAATAVKEKVTTV